MPGRNNHGENPTKSSQHTVRSVHGSQLLGCLYTVLYGQNNRRESNQGLDEIPDLRYLPCLDGHEDDVDRADLLGGVGGLHRRHRKISQWAFYAQTMRAKGLQVLAPGNEYDILAHRSQATAKVPADATHSNHRYAHGITP